MKVRDLNELETFFSVNRKFTLKDTSGELSASLKYFLSIAISDKKFLAEVMSISSIAQVYSSCEMYFLSDHTIRVECVFTDLGQKVIHAFDPDLNGKILRVFNYKTDVEEIEGKIIYSLSLLRADGRVYGKYLIDKSFTVLKTSDIFSGETYVRDDADISASDNELIVVDEFNLLKAGCWYDAFSEINEKWKDEYGMRYKDVRYGKNERNLLDIYLPKNLKTNRENGVLISIHGGGWTSGSKDDEEALCVRYAKKGYITAAISYSYIDLENKSTMFTILDEVLAALSKIKFMSEEHGWNITKAALFGGSAGAHIAMLHAYAHNSKGALPIVFVAEQVGPIDLRPQAWQNLSGTPIETYETYAGAGIGHKITLEEAKNGKCEELFKLVSPIDYVDSAVPTILAHGLCDGIVNPINGEILSKKLTQYGIKNDYFPCPNCNHLMACDKAQRKKFFEKIDEYLKEYFQY